MDIIAYSGVPRTIARSGTELNNTTETNPSQRQLNSALGTDAAVTASYRVSLSTEGINRSKAQFEAGLENDRRSFERRLAQEESAKLRELDAEKRQFEQSQTAEQHTFDNSQRIERMRYAQQHII